MALKIVVFVAFTSMVSAGGPAAYGIISPSGGYGSVGLSQEHTVKSYGGQSVVSEYSKAVDSPHSSVRISNSKITNDVAIAAPALKTLSYGAPALSYAAPALSYAAPALKTLSYGAPALSYAAPSLGYAAPALGLKYSAAPAVSYSSLSYAAPAAYAAPLKIAAAPLAYAAPALKVAAAPALSYASSISSYGYATPSLGYGYSGLGWK